MNYIKKPNTEMNKLDNSLKMKIKRRENPVYGIPVEKGIELRWNETESNLGNAKSFYIQKYSRIYV